MPALLPQRKPAIPTARSRWPYGRAMTPPVVIWIGCPNMDNEQVYQSIPGNLTFLQGCAASLVGQSLLIDTKALEAAPITVPASASMTLGMVFVFVLPAAVLIAGAVEVLLSRRR